MKNITIHFHGENEKNSEERQSHSLCSIVFDTLNSDTEELGKKHTSILKFNVGDKVPNFRLLNTLKETVNLYEILETKKIVLAFYMGTWCPYCNLMLSQYQTALPEIERAGAILLAISPQTPDESLNIKEKNNLQFEVLSDNGNIISKEFTTIYNIPKKSLTKMTESGNDYDSYYCDEASAIPIPAIFIIEKDRTISFAKTEGIDYRNRVEAYEIINALNKK